MLVDVSAFSDEFQAKAVNYVNEGQIVQLGTKVVSPSGERNLTFDFWWLKLGPEGDILSV